MISESERTCNFLKSQLRDRDFICSESYTVADMHNSMSTLLTKLRERKPDLIWISSLHHDNKSKIPESTQIAARLLISEQHSRRGQFVLENANAHDAYTGIQTGSEWQSKNYNGRLQPLHFCALAMPANRANHCFAMSCFASVDIPKTLVNCNLLHKFDGRSIMPSRNSKAYYSAFAAMIKETTSLAHAKLNVAKKSEVQPPQGGFDDGPGEHADVDLEKPSKADKEIENVFGDCGDDVSTLADSEAYSFFDDNSDHDCDDDPLSFDEEIYAWACPGSEGTPLILFQSARIVIILQVCKPHLQLLVTTLNTLANMMSWNCLLDKEALLDCVFVVA